MADTKFKNKIKLGDLVLPVGVAVYPHLTKPDTKWKEAGEYRTKVKYDAATAEPLREQLTKYLDEAFEKFAEALAEDGKKAKVKSLKRADLPLKPEVDEEGDETGDFLVSAKRTASGVSKKTGEKWHAKIKFADSKGQLVKTKGLSIWSGSELRLYVTVFGWYGAKDNEVGVSLDIDGVQIKKLVSGGNGKDIAFGDMGDDGWTASESEDGDGDDADVAETTEDGDDTPDF